MREKASPENLKNPDCAFHRFRVSIYKHDTAQPKLESYNKM